MSTVDQRRRPDPSLSSTGSLVLAGVVFVVSVVAFVVLELAGRPTNGLMLLCGPAVGALIVSGQLQYVTSRQNRTLDNIEAQTNGNLSRRDSKIEELTQELVQTKAEAAALRAAQAGTVPAQA